jgi:hypothetical protein
LKSHFKDLKRMMEVEQSQQDDSPQMKKLLSLLHKKPFYRWKIADDVHEYLCKRSKGSCCFNHIVGLPEKAGRRHNLYDYERMAFMALDSFIS